MKIQERKKMEIHIVIEEPTPQKRLDWLDGDDSL